MPAGRVSMRQVREIGLSEAGNDDGAAETRSGHNVAGRAVTDSWNKIMTGIQVRATSVSG